MVGDKESLHLAVGCKEGAWCPRLSEAEVLTLIVYAPEHGALGAKAALRLGVKTTLRLGAKTTLRGYPAPRHVQQVTRTSCMWRHATWWHGSGATLLGALCSTKVSTHATRCTRLHCVHVSTQAGHWAAFGLMIHSMLACGQRVVVYIGQQVL